MAYLKKFHYSRPWAILGGLGVLVFLFLSSCQTREPGEYVNRGEKFSLSFPEDWEIKEGEMGLSVIALSPQQHLGDEFRENVSVASSRMTKPLDGDAILDANLPSMMKVITDFKPGERSYKTIGEIKAACLTYSQRQGRMNLDTTIYALPGNQRAYLIYCTAEAKAAKLYREKFDKIVESFRVRK